MPSFTDLIWKEGDENLGGMIGNVYFIPKSILDTSGLTVDADGISLTGNIAVKDAATQEAVEIYATEDTVQLTDTQGGSVDGENTTQTLIFFHPGGKKEQASLKRKLTVTPGIWIAKDSEGNWRVVGLAALQDPSVPGSYKVSTDIQARVTAKEGTQGTRADTRKGTTYTVTYICTHEALFYNGDIPRKATPVGD